jgi:16S rRNA (uracil1498-N3)-methyltransferase
MRFVYLTKENGRIKLDKGEVEHLKALRKRSPLTIQGLLDSQLYEVVLEGHKNNWEVVSYDYLRDVDSPDNLPVIWFPLIDWKRLEFGLEKLCEIGSFQVRFFYSDHSSFKDRQVEQFQKKLPRLNKLVRQACQQSGNLLAPYLHLPASFNELITRIDSQTLVMSELDESDSVSLEQAWKEAKTVVVGPEGGFSQNEFENIKKSGATLVHVPGPIFRAETAIIFAASGFRFFS